MSIIRDRLHFIRKQSLAKVANASKLLMSYFLSRFSGRTIQWGLPISVSIEPTTSCNLRCPECPSGKREFTRPTGMLTESLFHRVIDDMKSHMMYLIFYFQGEPYLNPGFLDFVRYASDAGIYTATSTNAHYLTETNAEKTVKSRLDKLLISIDGTTQETYEKYRIGGDLQKVLEGTRNIVAAKKRLKSKLPHVVLQFLVVKPNEHQVEEMKNLAKELQVDELVFKTAQVYNYAQGNKLIPENPKYARYRKNKEGKYEIKNELLNHCWRLWHGSVITWDGRVVPCCYDKDATHNMGSVADSSFREIWKNERYMNFRKSLMVSRKEIDICKNCSEGTKVWVE